MDIAPKDLDEIVVIVPDTNKEELEHFQNFVYGDNFEEAPNAFKNLFNLLQINNFQNDILLETSAEIHEEALTNLNEELEKVKTADIKKLLSEEPERLTFEELEYCSDPKVLANYSQVLVDYTTVPFVKCKHCQAVFMQTSTTSNTVLKRHSVQHKTKKKEEKSINSKKLTLTDIKVIIKNEPERVGESGGEGNSEVWEHFNLLSVDDLPVPFAKCSKCEAVLIYSSKSGTSTLRKHIQTHVKNQRGKHLKKKFKFELKFSFKSPN